MIVVGQIKGGQIKSVRNHLLPFFQFRSPARVWGDFQAHLLHSTFGPLGTSQRCAAIDAVADRDDLALSLLTWDRY